MSTLDSIDHAPAPAQGADLFILLRGMLWRPWLVVSITLVGSLLAILVAALMPPVYQSTARILVESQQIPDALARSTITASAAERLALIEQRLMTRANLLDMARRLDLFSERSNLSPTDRVELLRNKTRIESISFNANPRYRGPTLVSAFTISFESEDARRAAQVANEFADMVLAQNLAARTSRATETHDFFRAELERLGDELGVLEAAIAAHKSKNKDYLPGSMKLRLTELTALRQQMIARTRRIARIEGKTEAFGAFANVEPEQTAFDPIASGQLELLRVKQSMTQDRIVSLQTAIDRTTRVEMELNALQRQHELLEIQHKDALRKATEAATGQKLENSRQAERFEIIEQAHTPDAPIAPRRIFIVIGGILASLSLAVVITGLLEWFSGRVRSAADFQRMLNVRPVLVTPNIPARHEIRQARFRRAAISASAVVVLLAGLWFSPVDLPGPELLPSTDIADHLRIFGMNLLASDMK